MLRAAFAISPSLAMLMFDGQIPADESMIDAMVIGELGTHTATFFLK